MKSELRLLLGALAIGVMPAAWAQGTSPAESAGETDAILQRPAWPSHIDYTNRHVGAPVGNKEAAPVDLPEPGGSRVAGAGPVSQDSGYLVQVGAFRQQVQAGKAVDEANVAGLNIRRTKRSGQTWYVLVLGPYPDRVEALAAARAWIEANPGGETWVRRAADVRDSPASSQN